ncbi:MAG: hypothetical protein EXS63_05675 [Candidatus Omnitrophica bacterium]|nr:hypothetical protein [Candidatus Omnitrophota bacterium]
MAYLSIHFCGRNAGNKRFLTEAKRLGFRKSGHDRKLRQNKKGMNGACNIFLDQTIFVIHFKILLWEIRCGKSNLITPPVKGKAKVIGKCYPVIESTKD